MGQIKDDMLGEEIGSLTGSSISLNSLGSEVIIGEPGYMSNTGRGRVLI